MAERDGETGMAGRRESSEPGVIRGTQSILLIFAPSEKSPAFENQISVLRSEKLIENGWLVPVTVLHEGACYIGQDKLDEPEAAALRKEFGVDDSEFVVVLLAEDGSEVYRGDAPVQAGLIRERLSRTGQAED